MERHRERRATGCTYSLRSHYGRAAARLLADLRVNWADFTAAKLARLEAMLGKFGMSPADRAKVAGGGKQNGDNPFAQLLG